jgi:hypothetical protein
MNDKKKVKIPYSGTTIPPERTKADIEKMLNDHNVSGIQWTTYQGKTSLKFIWKVMVKGVEKEILFSFTPPVIPSLKRSWTGTRYEKINVNLEATSYRLLWHYLKNKLEAVRWGLESMEKEFLSHAVTSLPDGTQRTVGDSIEDVLEVVRSPSLTYVPQNGQQERKIIDVEGEKS